MPMHHALWARGLETVIQFSGALRYRSPQLYLLGLFLVGALIAFSPNLNSYFLSDDFVQIGKVLHRDFSVSWGQEHGGFFRPLFIWSYLIDSRIWGARPFGYHFTNVILHGLNAFLVFKLALKLVQSFAPTASGRRGVAIAAGSLFLLHPSHTEAVTWISGRADLLATCFLLTSLLAYLGYAARARKSRLSVSLGCFVLALLAKESAICLPFLILVVSVALRGHGRRASSQILKTFVLFLAILAGFIVVRAFFIGSIIGGYGTTQHLNFSPGWIRDRLLEASVRSVLPSLPIAWLSFLYKPLQSPIFFLIVLIAITAIAIAAFVRRRLYEALERRIQNRFLLTLVVLFLVSLLPVISLRLSLYETLGERFLYLPTVFACLLIAYISSLWIRNRRVALLLLIGALSFCSWSLYRTNIIWREAAKLSHNLLADLVTASADQILILNAPDNLRGVPVFHNGLPEALKYFENRNQQVQIVAFQSLQSVNDRISLGESDKVLTMRSNSRTDVFDRVSSFECWEVVSQSANVVQLRPRPCPSAAQVFYWSDGRINNLSSGINPNLIFPAADSQANYSPIAVVREHCAPCD